jgi:hypothetical protein
MKSAHCKWEFSVERYYLDRGRTNSAPCELFIKGSERVHAGRSGARPDIALMPGVMTMQRVHESVENRTVGRGSGDS